MASNRCKHEAWEEIENSKIARCADCRKMITPTVYVKVKKPKPSRRRPTDSEILKWLLRRLRRSRRAVAEQMREEAKRGKK